MQYSVFELHRMAPAARKALASELAEMVSDPAGIRFYRLTLDGIEDSSDAGGNPLAKRPIMYIV